MTASPPFFCNTLCHLDERFSARTPFSRLSKEEKENGGWVGIKNKGLKPQDVASLASEGVFITTEWRFKKSKEGFFNKNLMKEMRGWVVHARLPPTPQHFICESKPHIELFLFRGCFGLPKALAGANGLP